MYLVYAVFASRTTEHRYFNQKFRNFRSIIFLPIIQKSVTENPKTLSESEKCEETNNQQISHS